MNKPVIYTIGHSTRTLTEFMDLLHAYDVSQIVDVRTIPKSRHNPQFNGAELKTSLRQSGIHYRPISKLGGLRQLEKGIQEPRLAQRLLPRICGLYGDAGVR